MTMYNDGNAFLGDVAAFADDLGRSLGAEAGRDVELGGEARNQWWNLAQGYESGELLRDGMPVTALPDSAAGQIGRSFVDSFNRSFVQSLAQVVSYRFAELDSDEETPT
jgi:hypothetical protein